MKVLFTSVLLAVVAFGQQFKIGSQVSDFSVSDLNGNPVPFSALKGDTTVVIFISTRCPVSNAYNDRMSAVYRDYSAKRVKFVFLNSNQNEPASEVEQHAREHGLAFPVYKDVNNTAADLFGAEFTPTTYVVDRSGTVRYQGRIDDAQNPARIHSQDLRTAIDAVLNGAPVANPQTKAFGCTIKRVKKDS
jgi:peroxiredoxin